MPNGTTRHIRTRDGVVVSDVIEELSDAEQAVKNRGLRLGQFKNNSNPPPAETAQALQDLMEQLGF